MSTSALNFTKPALQNLKIPQGNSNAKGGVYDTYRDTKEKGLILVVSNGGSKTFYLYSKISGKPQRHKLGKFPEMGVEGARKKARKVRGEIADGKDPQAEKDKIKKDMLFADFFNDHFMKRYSEPFKKSSKFDRDQFRLHLGVIKNKKLLHITRGDIEKLHSDIGAKSGKYAANHVLELVKVVFNKAIEWGWEGQNPTALVRKFKKKSRERFLLPEELPRFFAALDQEPNENMRDFFYLSLFTGARKSNVTAMRWQDISFERETWRIEETKNGEAVTVNLVPEAIDLLKRREKAKRSEWVFPSESKSGHMQDPKAAWRRILMRSELHQLIGRINDAKSAHPDLKNVLAEVEAGNLKTALKNCRNVAKQLAVPMDDAGLKDLRIHDLRRTLGSWQAITGANTYVIGRSLGHKSDQSTSVYARLHNDPVKMSVKLATDTMLKYAGVR